MRRWLPALIEALIVLAAVYFEPTLTVRGKLRGEAFFEGKSTSSWRRELRQWNGNELWLGMGNPPRENRLHFYYRKPTWFDELNSKGWRFWEPAPMWIESSFDMRGPSILRGDPEAEPVLRVLLKDPSPEIRRFARIGLNLDKE
jgi:hypothetical protein